VTDAGRAEGFAPPLFSLTDLHIILGLAAGKTQAQIGEALHLEQSSISKLLKACEARSGVSIVDHRGRRLALSPAGRDLAVAAARTLRAFEDVDLLATALHDGTAGTVRVMASSTPGSYVLPPLVAEFLQLHPGAHVMLFINPVSELWEAFANERCDIGVVPEFGVPPYVKTERLYDDPVAFFAHPDSAIARRATVTWEDLRSETMVGKFVESHWSNIFHDLERNGFRAERALTIIPPEGVKRVVEAGLGVGILFESSVQRELRAGRLVRLPISDPSLPQQFVIARLPNATLSPVATAFVEHLRRRLGRGATYAATEYTEPKLEL
jgi:DNA-binding transcriptional LysR family regulator